MNAVYEAIEFINKQGRGDKHSFSASEELALIALRPFLEVIGGRIGLMVDMAITTERAKHTATQDSGGVQWLQWLAPKPYEGQHVIVKCVDGRGELTVHHGFFDEATGDAWVSLKRTGMNDSLTYQYGEIRGWIPYPRDLPATQNERKDI